MMRVLLLVLILAPSLAYAGQATVTYDDAIMAQILAPPVRPATPTGKAPAPAPKTLTPQQYLQQLVDQRQAAWTRNQQQRALRQDQVACAKGDQTACAKIKALTK